MKKLIIPFMALLLVQCQDFQPNVSSNSELSTVNKQLLSELKVRDSVISAMANTFATIESNLNSIKQQESIITINAKGIEGANNEESINNDINLIYKMMLDNRNRVENLQQLLNRANIKNADLQKSIDQLVAKIEAKDAEIASLRQRLEEMNINVCLLDSALNQELGRRIENEATIARQDADLHTGYYIIGSERELKDVGVLDKRGKFALGSRRAVNEFNHDVFTIIDIRKTLTFPLSTKKANVVTAHSTSAYKIYGDKLVDSLVVTNYEEFWRASKYLVIVVQ
ncbi:MAG: hypothetical protein MJ069_05400 [Salinivirgaceae bacterium]|nr:hypothetical protein [Salinivirgaceae bacterium]